MKAGTEPPLSQLEDLAAAEAALKAWASCMPLSDGTMPEGRMAASLPMIAAHVPGGTSDAGKVRRLSRLFRWPPRAGEGLSGPRVPRRGSRSCNGAAPFMQRLRAHGGKVHFPYFWRAFSDAARVVATAGSDSSSSSGSHDSSESSSEDGEVAWRCGGGPGLVGLGLADELEALRDEALHMLETGLAVNGVWALPTSALAAAVERAAAASSVPEFWCTIAEGGCVRKGARQLSLEEVSAEMLSWLRSAAAWQRARAEVHTVLVQSPAVPRSVETAAALDEKEGLPVHLNIYDVSKEGAVQWLNAVFAHWLAPVKLGGAFHAGVEVHGFEWSFGATTRETLPGISCALPRTNPQHHFRQTVYLGRTKLSMASVTATITDLIEEYPGQAYDLLRRNCCHFADDFCRRLKVGPIPGWVHRLTRFGAGADGVVQAVFGASACDLAPSALGASLPQSSSYPMSEWNAPAKEWMPADLVSSEPVPVSEDSLCPGPL